MCAPSSGCERVSAKADGEAISLLPLSSSSLPPSHYFHTCPHLLTTSPPPAVNHQITTSTSLNDYRRQSLKNDENPRSRQQHQQQQQLPDLSDSSNRSTSSPQLMSVRRSKVYRRASLKSLVNLPLATQPATQSRVVKMASRNKLEKRLAEPKANCEPTAQPCSTPILQDKPSSRPKLVENEKQPNKSKTCSSFLPILSLIPHTVKSFQYPSPKMKFSWWRNKIS